jgi:hypothetical protein
VQNEPDLDGDSTARATRFIEVQAVAEVPASAATTRAARSGEHRGRIEQRRRRSSAQEALNGNHAFGVYLADGRREFRGSRRLNKSIRDFGIAK